MNSPDWSKFFQSKMLFQVFSKIVTMINRRILKPSKVTLNSNIILQSKIYSSSFHEAMKFSLQLAQCFGLFPIYVGGPICKGLKIKWFHWRMFYFLLTLGFAVFILFTQLVELIEDIHKSLGISKYNYILLSIY